MADWQPGKNGAGILFRQDGPWRVWTWSTDEPRAPGHQQIIEELQIDGSAAVTFLIGPDGTVRGGDPLLKGEITAIDPRLR